MKKFTPIIVLSILATQLLSAQSSESLKIKKQTQQNAKEIINEFTTFLRIPNVAENP